MSEEPNAFQRFADRYDAAYAKIKSSPEYKRKRRLAFYQVICLLVIGLPAALLLVAICEWFRLSRSVYVPVAIMIGIGGGQLLGSYLASRKSSSTKQD